MKGFVRIIYTLLLAGLVFSISGCKTTEKVSENFKENAQTSTTEIKEDIRHDERHERESSIEQVLQTSERDSLVEKFRERVVVDSCGRVLFKDCEYSKEHYLGKGVAKVCSQKNNSQFVAEQSNRQTQSQTDSIKSSTQNNTVKTTKPTYRWLWFLGLLMLMLSCGAFISKMTQ